MKNFFIMLFSIIGVGVLFMGSILLAKYINFKLLPSVDAFLVWLGLISIIVSAVYAHIVKD